MLCDYVVVTGCLAKIDIAQNRAGESLAMRVLVRVWICLLIIRVAWIPGTFCWVGIWGYAVNVVILIIPIDSMIRFIPSFKMECICS